MLISILICIACIVFVMLSINWVVHIQMTNEWTNASGWSNYETFKKYFNKVDWTGDVNEFNLKNRKYNINSDCEIFANIVKFDGKGLYVMYLKILVGKGIQILGILVYVKLKMK